MKSISQVPCGINLFDFDPFPSHEVDPEVFAALPAELQKELKAAYGQRQRPGESAHPQAASAAGEPGEWPPARSVREANHCVSWPESQLLVMLRGTEQVDNIVSDIVLVRLVSVTS